MAEAFACDACLALQEGKPSQRVTITPRQGVNVTEDWCDPCVLSFSDWRLSRDVDRGE